MVPNICHFIAGMSPDEEFKFVYYVAAVSAIKINKPKRVNYFYSFEPHGRWWEELKKIKEVEKKVELEDFEDALAMPVSLVPNVCKNLTFENMSLSFFNKLSGIVSVP